MGQRFSWGTRLGFYLAAIGSAFGLGNLWRFPYIVSENGGGAFVLLYLFTCFFIGIPLLTAELMIGKSTQKSILGALSVLPQGRKWRRWIGRLSVITSLIVVSYYAVISGWVLYFLLHLLMAIMGSGAVDFSAILGTLLHNGFLQMALVGIHLLITIVVVMRGVRDGLERWVGYMMPVFALLLVVLVTKSLSLPTAEKAVRFLFYPDFAKLSVNSLGQALGHVLFTLSLGFGVMVTFGSYLREDVVAPLAGFRVAMVDTVISLFTGLLIFPVLLSSGVGAGDPTVLFQTLPLLLLKLEGGLIFGFFFFLCLYLAALGASIGLFESIVSNWMERVKVDRKKATWTTGSGALFLAVIPALSSNQFGGLKINGREILEVVDAAIINWLLPIVALGISVVAVRSLSQSVKEREFQVQTNHELSHLLKYWVFSLRWVVPGFILLALALQLWGLIR